jgi:hypothetical protein
VGVGLGGWRRQRICDRTRNRRRTRNSRTGSGDHAPILFGTATPGDARRASRRRGTYRREEVMRERRRQWSVVATLLATLGLPHRAAAQSGSDAASRRLLLEQAQRARDENRHRDALDLARRAGAIQMTVSLRAFIAREEGDLGMYAAALNDSELCYREIIQTPPTYVDRQAILETCQTLNAFNRARVGSVVVSVPSPAPDGLRVTVNGQELREVLFGQSYIVNPGSVSIDASATGRRFHRDVRVASGQTVQVAVELVASAPVRSANIVMPPHREGARRVSSGPFVAMGIGAAGLGTFAGLLVARNGAVSELDVRCMPPDRPGHQFCVDDASGVTRGLVANAQGLNTGSIVVLSVGAAAMAGGVLWLIVDRATAGSGSRRGRDLARVHVWGEPTSSGSGLMVRVGGAW